MPGSIPATSQLHWLISTTAMIVLSWSRATRDLLKSFGWGIKALHQLATTTMVPSPRRLPIPSHRWSKPDSEFQSPRQTTDHVGESDPRLPRRIRYRDAAGYQAGFR